MSKALAEIQKEAHELPPAERELLVLDLIESLESEQKKRIDEIWNEEAVKRLAAMKDGSLELIDGDEAFKTAYAALDEKL